MGLNFSIRRCVEGDYGLELCADDIPVGSPQKQHDPRCPPDRRRCSCQFGFITTRIPFMSDPGDAHFFEWLVEHSNVFHEQEYLDAYEARVADGTLQRGDFWYDEYAGYRPKDFEEARAFAATMADSVRYEYLLSLLEADDLLYIEGIY